MYKTKHIVLFPSQGLVMWHCGAHVEIAGKIQKKMSKALVIFILRKNFSATNNRFLCFM